MSIQDGQRPVADALRISRLDWVDALVGLETPGRIKHDDNSTKESRR